MQAYKLCDVDYKLKNMMESMMRGSGSLWISTDSLLIKINGKWIKLPKNNIVGAALERKILRIMLRNKVCVEVNSKNDYIINALYHYLEGALWQKT